MATASTQLNRCTIDETRRLLELEENKDHQGPFIRHDPLNAIQKIVEACYNTLEAHYGESQLPGDRISFEATVMTRDPADQEVTVIAWANREGRQPDSLRARVANPKVYERSVTADIYRSADTERPCARIVENTSSEPYTELYPGQKDRIRSSIVYPVISTASVLLGTLVVHCDEPVFFSNSDSKYWFEFLQTFAGRIALEKLRLDLLPGWHATTDAANHPQDPGGAHDDLYDQ
jgi:GAF domain-containing protein